MVNKEGWFLKNYTKKYARQSSNIGYRLNLAPNLMTTHFGWRSVATALADAGISITNLKRAGRWKSDAVAEGYLENLTAQKNAQMSMLSAKSAKKVKKNYIQ
eukprot:12216143-Ditylum_brightwellii.AAC.1